LHKTFALLLVISSFGARAQSLDRVVAESRKLGTLAAAKGNSQDLQLALRDWAESLLPRTAAALTSELPRSESAINAALRGAGLRGRTGWDLSGAYTPGAVESVKLRRPKEDATKVVLTIGVEIPCGDEEATYVYDYSGGSPRRVIESPVPEGGSGVLAVDFSAPDRSGMQSILVLRYGVQCGSSWNRLDYDWHRLAKGAKRAISVLQDQHYIWFSGNPAYHVRLTGDELLIELLDRSIDVEVHHRTHVLHYRATGGSAERIDPVALQPQDFVDEWLTRPWSEMESRSVGGNVLEKWHEDIGGGQYLFVQRCRNRADTQIGLMADGRSGYFVVHQLDQYRFEMKSVSFERQEGCPGESPALTDGPSLFPKR